MNKHQTNNTCRATILSACLLILGVLGAAPRLDADSSASSYQVIKKLPLPGDGGWDCLTLDPQARLLYISHSSQVQVLDIDSYTLVGQIPNTPGVHAIALAPDLNKGFTSNGKDGTVTVFDLTTRQALAVVPVGENPDAIVYDSTTSRVFTMNAKSQDATALDASSGTVVKRITLGGKPEFAEVDGSGMLYVNLEDKSVLVSLDTRRLRMKKRTPLNGCFEPSSLAMDRANRRLFVGCRNQVMLVVNADSGHVLERIPIGAHVDGTVYDPGSAQIFTSNGDGTITVIQQNDADHYHVLANVPTQMGARTLAFDPVTHRLFLDTAQLGPVPTPTVSHPRTRAPVIPGTFTLLVVGPVSDP